MPRALALAAALFLLGAPAAAAQQQPPVTIVDADKPLAVAAEAVPVRILNNTDEELPIKVTATAVADDGRTVTIEVQNPPRTIPRAATRG
ncbi:hypothetical protein ACFQV2_10190 [Actinokineospora soli]|uniref:Uncharacterized protein n=1 Tax=Actinokineospora soli TaxID=1048753 RepID=A0ABW2TJJ8_9PSEU